MSKSNLSAKEERHIQDLVKHYKAHIGEFHTLVKIIDTLVTNNAELQPYIHSVKHRVKDPTHLENKLRRKAIEAKAAGKKLNVTVDNLFSKISDLAGYRILHLHTKQMEFIKPALAAALEEQQYVIVEGPIANTWDDEYRKLFQDMEIETANRESMYMSVHYIVKLNSKAAQRCEIQVRTLMEEVWGEVSHLIDYPQATQSVACREQLRVLARLSSGGTRLVDSIFASQGEFAKLNAR